MDFSVPNDLLFRNIDPRTGLLSTEHCKLSLREVFLPGTEPRKFCEEKLPVEEDIAIQDEAPE